METIDDKLTQKKDLIISSEIKDYLTTTARWAKFLSILGFIGLGFMVIGSLVVLFIQQRTSTPAGYSGMNMSFLGLLYLIFAVLYFFPVYYLYKFSSDMQNGLRNDDQFTVTTGFESLKSHYKYIGIFTVTVLSLYLVIFIIALMGMGRF